MHDRVTHTAARRRALAALAVAAAAFAAPSAMAERLGQVRSVDFEEQRIVIDDRTYRIGETLVPRYGSSGRMADLRRVRPGMPVEYELSAGTGGATVIELRLLADD